MVFAPYIGRASRVVQFDLHVGQALPEYRVSPVMLVARNDVELGLGRGSLRRTVRLSAGESLILPDGVEHIANQGGDLAQFTLIDLHRSNFVSDR